MCFEIISATTCDAKNLVSLMKQLQTETNFMAYEASEVPSHEMLSKRILSSYNNFSEVFLLARDIDKLLGYSLISRGKLSRNKGVGTFALGVVHYAQKQGIGSGLIRESILWANHNDLYRLQLHVDIDNEHAIKLYKKFGFEIEGVMKKCALVKGLYIDKYQMAMLL